MSSVNSSPQTKAGHKAWQLYVVLLTPLIVILSSTLLYFSGWVQPNDTVNHGTLIQPPVDVVEVELAKDDRYWWLVTSSMGGCGADCEEQLFWVQQVHIALGKESPRVRRHLLTAEPVDLQQEYPGLIESTGNLAPLAQESPVQLFVVDPLGNVMMTFNSDQRYEQVLKDLKTLLKRSSIG
ncbi:MAG: hypothetical protein JXQ97_02980 [Natronospirillum sp.]